MKPDKFKLGIAILASALAIYLLLILSLASKAMAGTPTSFIVAGRAIGGELGVLTANLLRWLGYGAFVIPFGLFYFSWHLINSQQVRVYPLFFQLAGVILMLSSAAGLANLMTDSETATGPGGGVIGGLVSHLFSRAFSPEFSAILLFFIILLSLSIAAGGRWFAIMEDLNQLIRKILGAR